MQSFSKAPAAIERARAVMPVGTSSPLRACRNVDHDPLVISKASGQYIYDIDGNRYLDFMCGFGPLILGHAHPEVVSAISEQAARGTLYGAYSEQEIELAEAIAATADHLDQVRFACSGTEAVMATLRLARAYTQRTKVVRFRGSYHGHFDLVQNAGPDRFLEAGLDPAAMKSNLKARYNDIDSVRVLFEEYPDEIAAVVIEPIAANMSLVLPEPTFLHELRELCTAYGAVLIFDEVIVGFRLTYGPASNLLNVAPDLTAFGKIVGGGTPVGAFGGDKKIMRLLDEEKVLQGGTFSGNPLTMAAGLATLRVLKRPGFYEELERKSQLLENEVVEQRAAFGGNFTFTRIGSIFAFIFVPEGTPIRNQADVARQAHAPYTRLYAAMRSRGIHLAPDIEEPMYVSAVTGDDELINFAREAVRVIVDA